MIRERMNEDLNAMKSLFTDIQPAGRKSSDLSQSLLLKENININSILNNIYIRFRRLALMKGLEFRYDTTLDGSDAEILTSGLLLEIIFSSLIRNAIADTDIGYISFGYMKKGDYLEIYVADTGRGSYYENSEAPESDKQQLTFSTFPGINLKAGINDCKVLVKSLGGKMWIKSDPWDGSVCMFTIPYITTGKSTGANQPGE